MNYKVTPNEDYIDPEETLADSLSGHSMIEKPISSSVFNLFTLILSGILFFYLFSAVKMQIVSGNDFKEAAMENISLNYYVPPPRGFIYDRWGKELVYNVPEFDILAVSKELPSDEAGLSALSLKISPLIESSTNEIENILSLKSDQSLLTVKKNIQTEDAIKILQKDFPGIYVIPVPKRVYEDGNYFAHVLGYVGGINKNDLESDDYYKIKDTIGKSGIELFYEDYLRGVHGIKNFTGNGGEIDAQKEKPGSSVVLNIDYDVQKKLYQDLLIHLKSEGLSKGAAILQNPNNGAVISLVSIPSYDPNVFQEKLSESDFNNIFENKNKPLLNRVISGLYNPASTIKPLLALAGLKEGVITPQTTITDKTGYITLQSVFDPSVTYTYNDWKIQGTIDLKKAIANSSNIFFYSVGGGYGDIKGLGISKISSYLKDFLADSVLGIDIFGEKSGFVPTADWKKETKGEVWFKGDTFNVSIGHGDLTVTPLWINSYVSAIANGGTIYKPEIANKIVGDSKRAIKFFEKEEIGKVNFSPQILDAARSGMRETVVSGTAKLLSGVSQPIAAKTGTSMAVKGNKLNSFVMAYGPYQDPEVALTIIVEDIGPTQQGMALRVAKDFLEWYFNRQ